MAKHSTKEFSAALVAITRVPSQIAPAVADRFSELTQENFDNGVDPYGKAWQELAPATLAKGRTPPPLTNSRKGRNGVHFKPAGGSGVAATSDVPYMGIHQNGAPHIPRRSFLPVGTLPKKWRGAWQDELTKAVKAKLK